MGQHKSKSKQSSDRVDDKNLTTQLAKQTESTTPTEADLNIVPSWVTAELFTGLLKEHVPGFARIKKFYPYSAMPAGENYMTLVLRVKIDVELEDKSIWYLSYVLKVPHDNAVTKQMLSAVNFFITENTMYFEVLPELEELYRQAGNPVGFAPKAYKFDSDPGVWHVLLEDLRPRGFQNVNRFEGLDKAHTELALKKLAQLHAATAHRVATKGTFGAVIENSFNTERAVEMFLPLLALLKEPFLKNMENSVYYKEMLDMLEHFEEGIRMTMKCNENEFNVLNHGDCWTNNMLFQYSIGNELTEVLFVDFQAPKFGPPVQDLYYFLLSSVKLDIKFKHFDHFIRYYYDNLIESLQLLKYPKKLPTMRELQLQLIKYGIWAFNTCVMTLPVVLLAPKTKVNIDDYMAPTPAGEKFRNMLYSNEVYLQYMQEVLPWLHNRGLLQPYHADAEAQTAVAAKPTTDTISVLKAAEPAAKPATEASAVSKQSTAAAATDRECQYPDWVDEKFFTHVVKQDVATFQQIKNFKVSSATSAGENYSSTLLKINIDAELQDGALQPVSYMLKIEPSDVQSQMLQNLFQSFEKENLVYHNILPQFEKLYHDVGLEVTFGPKSYQPSVDVGSKILILQNLQTSGFVNADRRAGLNEEHVKCVLTKLAQFHAASAVVYETKGKYDALFNHSMFREEQRQAMEQAGDSYFMSFYNAMRDVKGSEEYMDKLLVFGKNFLDIMLKVCAIDENAFNVLNHGDCWTNNIMFQYNDEGKMVNTYFVDYQLTKYGSPAQDLLYFLLSSCALDIKVVKFEHFIKYYHDELKKYLQMLKYTKPIPTLKELHMELFRRGDWGIFTVDCVLSTALLNPTDEAQIDVMMDAGQKGADLRAMLFTSEAYRQQAQLLLKWLNERGLLDFEFTNTQPSQQALAEQAASDAITKSEVTELIKTDSALQYPDWANEKLFTDIVKQDVAKFKQIKNLQISSASSAGENYSSTLLKADIDAELQDGAQQRVSFMLKIEPSDTLSKMLQDLFNSFKKEIIMYRDILPQFEQVYRDVGLEVTFGPKSYQPSVDVGSKILILQNLQTRGFVNADRRAGLNEEHVKCVLTKLAQFHAASAVVYETKGKYDALFDRNMFYEEQRQSMEQSGNSYFLSFCDAMRNVKGSEEYIDKLYARVKFRFDNMLKVCAIDENAFNVLNHGDCWTNNIMFQYNDEGKIVNTYFVDYQLTKYGSPAQDLFYFLLSSSALDIKVEKFDYFIKYYHDELRKYLQLLKYTKPIPTLKELHMDLFRKGDWALFTVNCILSTALLDPTDKAQIDVMLDEGQKGADLRAMLFTSEKYREHAEVVLKWLNRRGLLDKQ